MKKRYWVLSLSVLLALIAACSSGAEQEKGTDPRVTAEQVPVVAAQALTLRFGLGNEVSLQDVGEQDAASLLVEDIDGYPLVYLTVLGPKAKGNFWEAAQAAVAAGEGHYLVATGASTFYSPTLFADTGTDTLKHISAVVSDIGGPNQAERVVSFGEPGRYYLVDQAGVYHDAYSGEALDAATVDELAAQFHQTMDRLGADKDYLETMSHIWACLLGEASEEECQEEDASAEALEAKEVEAGLLSTLGYDPAGVQNATAQTQAEGMTLADMTAADGELDFAKAQKIIEKGGANNYSNYEEVSPQWRHMDCMDWFCFGQYWTLEARINKNQPVRKGYEWHTVGRNWQNVSDYGYRWKDYFDSGNNDSYSDNDSYPQKFSDSDWNNFALYHMFDPAINGGMPVGCGPAAFIRLVAWFQFERHWYTGRSNVNWYRASVPSFPDNYHVSNKDYMLWKHSWLGGRMLTFSKQRFWINDHYTYLYKADLPYRMQTKALDSGGLTLPSGFLAGANSWLASRGSNLRLYGGGYVFILNLLPPIGGAVWNAEVWKMYREAMGSIGLRNEPGIALHPFGDGQYHYSPTLEVRLINLRTRAVILVRVSWAEDSPLDGKFVNISGGIAGGFYALR